MSEAHFTFTRSSRIRIPSRYTVYMVNGNGVSYTEQGRIFLSQAFDELARDDLMQASEKGWGAAAQVVKAAAEERGLPHDSHGFLFRAVRTLIDETDDDSLMFQFNIAGGLHSNFYQGGYGSRQVRAGLEQVSQFMDKVEGLLNGRNGS